MQFLTLSSGTVGKLAFSSCMSFMNWMFSVSCTVDEVVEDEDEFEASMFL